MCHTSNEFTNYILRGILSFFLKRSSFIVAGAITRPLTRLPNISQTCSTRFVSVEFSNTNFCQVFTDSPRCMWSGVILHQDKVSINKWSEWNQMVCQNFSMYYCAGSELPSMKTNSIEGAIDIYSVMTKPGVKIVPSFVSIFVFFHLVNVGRTVLIVKKYITPLLKIPIQMFTSNL